jgi:hypothetical protein
MLASNRGLKEKNEAVTAAVNKNKPCGKKVRDQ